MSESRADHRMGSAIWQKPARTSIGALEPVIVAQPPRVANKIANHSLANPFRGLDIIDGPFQIFADRLGPPRGQERTPVEPAREGRDRDDQCFQKRQPIHECD